jgi:YidC/Oxa1 family membrane protein insertase
VDQIIHFFNLIFTYPIFNTLMLLYRILFNDLGLAIIVLTMIIRLALVPLTRQQLKSSKAMQELQPEIKRLREKYKDQQQQAKALQELYKEKGVNPLAGCLPLLIQLPVLYGLYYALSNVIRDATLKSVNNIIYPFLPHFTKFPDINLKWFTFIDPHWFISLGQPDPTHILPILAGLATFLQLRMSQPKTAATSGSTDMMSQQMKLMQYIMPFITVFFAWQFAAGLALYWTTSSVFGMVQQYFVTGWGSLPSLFSPLSGLFKSQDKITGDRKPARSDAKKPQRLDEGDEEEGTARSNGSIEDKLATSPGDAKKIRRLGGTDEGAEVVKSARPGPIESQMQMSSRNGSASRMASPVKGGKVSRKEHARNRKRKKAGYK